MPNVGNYFVVKTKGLAGLAIRLGTGSHWNHAGIYLGNGKIVEARPVGVTISDLSKYDGMSIVWNSTVDNLTDEERMQIVTRARGFVGDKYGVWSIIALFFKCLGLSLFPANRRAENENSVICSQLVAWSYSVGGIKISFKQHALVTPKDLAERCIKTIDLWSTEK